MKTRIYAAPAIEGLEVCMIVFLVIAEWSVLMQYDFIFH